MLKLVSELFHDPATAEKQLLAGMLRESPELPEWSAAVQPVLARLLARNAIRKELAVRVLDVPFNALALPHRTIVLAQSLVDFCRDDPGQMAFVLAHEVAHAHLGHAAERSRANALAGALGTANVLAGMGLRFLLDRAFSRAQEFEADMAAAGYCAAAGYPSRAAVAFLERLAALDRSAGAVPLLDAHPPTADRLTRLRAAVGA